ncbi:glycosyltransferase [Mongoliimonas terrestris]|uniref:glycosyltransferase n=1 Tax=Mongoliimonas terrestris TaxID=1709001 RepID=UPI0009499690|nr:glycosyltransferase [Mongoliimonas terrestris]
MTGFLKIDLSPAVVTVEPALNGFADQWDLRDPIRVGWFLPSKDTNSASNRYRCFHMARALAGQGVESVYLTTAEELSVLAPRIDILVIVKRLDKEVIAVAARARERSMPVFLDLCDDLMGARYPNNMGGAHQMVFSAIARQLAGIVVPSAQMAGRIGGYCADLSVDLPIHVVPDPAETEADFLATETFVTGQPASWPDDDAPPARPTRKTIIWFGNYGAPHGAFGIPSLLPALPVLQSLNRRIPLELVVVSNSDRAHDAIVGAFDVPTRYVPWTPRAVYRELRRADVALLTNGEDEYCTVKSSNRVLQALAMGVPVVATATQAVAEFINSVIVDQPKAGVLAFIGPDGERRRAEALEAARPILERYTPERIGRLWYGILARQRVTMREAPRAEAGGTTLVFLEEGRTFAALEALFGANLKPQPRFDVLADVGALIADRRFVHLFAAQGITPMLIGGRRDVYRHRLKGVGKLVVESDATPYSATFVRWAREAGIEVQSVQSYCRAILANPPPLPPPLAASPRQPGPYPERAEADGSSTWAFCVHQKARGWILDAICREIGSRQPDSWQVVYLPAVMPEAKNYFFSHHSLFLRYLKKVPEMLGKSKVFIWYTHPRSETPEAVAELLEGFQSATRVIFTCAANRDLWLQRGLPEEKTCVVLGGADAEMFRAHERGSGVVGLSSSFYERKNPDGLMEIVRLLPHRRFHLIGRHWEQYALFEELRSAPNFRYITVPYERYPEHYGRFDVFLSMSTLEGGPIPLLEAMMSNAVPVASRTGFGPDLIRHGENGFLFDIGASAAEIAGLIDAAFDIRTDVRATVVDHTWETFARIITEFGQ